MNKIVTDVKDLELQRVIVEVAKSIIENSYFREVIYQNYKR